MAHHISHPRLASPHSTTCYITFSKSHDRGAFILLNIFRYFLDISWSSPRTWPILVHSMIYDMSQVAFVCHRLGSLSPADLTLLHTRKTGTEDSRLLARTAYCRAARENAGTPSACPQGRGQYYGHTLPISSRHLHKPYHHKIKLSNNNEKVYIRMMRG